MKKYCIIVAGGSGRRMKSAVPKQFLLLGGKPVLMHTVERFHSFDGSVEIIIVLPAAHHALWKKLCAEYSFSVSHRVVAGGEERFHSVKAGLEAVADSAGELLPEEMSTGSRKSMNEGSPQAGDDILVAIHDGVRPLVSHDTIWRCFADAEEFGNAVPFIEPADSVRVLAGDDSRPVPRTEVRLIQTPQVFRGSVIMKAYGREYDPAFTDDATVAEASGVMIHLAHGNRENIKITTPEDLAVAETLAGMLRQ
ncbi:MAG: 2-C-methyl-D-erythritol 4-phosphate cytidylyltransferase [Bacteroidota bacterium]|nr:2-C-methyl-D-erythritol 4-phosphate cytidylyltransferase [Bacteroidota bacterium]